MALSLVVLLVLLAGASLHLSHLAHRDLAMAVLHGLILGPVLLGIAHLLGLAPHV